MLTDQDKIWLSQKYRGLVVGKGKISGEIEFTATYNEQSGRFLQIVDGVDDNVGGVRLSGRFNIRIEERKDTLFSKLPALFVEGLDYIPDRHFNQTDFSGCICNFLEEDEFLQPRFEFQKYLEKLVIPFLYGQLFFTREKRWPWPEYAHGGVGLLEAYSKNPTPTKADECLRKISRETPLWLIVKPLLLQKSNIGGHTLCPCLRRDQMRRCHSNALKGLRSLKEIIKVHNISLPQ